MTLETEDTGGFEREMIEHLSTIKRISGVVRACNGIIRSFIRRWRVENRSCVLRMSSAREHFAIGERMQFERIKW